MTGTLIYVMGPSGAGKDTVLELARRKTRGLPVVFVRRYITRRAAPGERHIPVSRERFARLVENGCLALHWQSHGLCYGVADSVHTALAQGLVLIVNGSRHALQDALTRFPTLVPVLVTASPAILRQRLRKRGRESEEEVRERLEQADMPLPADAGIHVVDNSGAPEAAAEALLDLVLRALEGAKTQAGAPRALCRTA